VLGGYPIWKLESSVLLLVSTNQIKAKYDIGIKFKTKTRLSNFKKIGDKLQPSFRIFQNWKSKSKPEFLRKCSENRLELRAN
jgi:hypothetical protein